MALRPLVVGGAALGSAYASNIFEDPITGTISAAIGAGIGSALVLPETRFKDMVNVPTGVKQDIDYINKKAVKGMQDREQEVKNSFNTKVASLLEDHTYRTNVNQVTQLLGQHRYNIPNFDIDPEGFVKALEDLDDKKLIGKVEDLLSEETKVISNVNTDASPKAKVSELHLSSTLTDKNKVDQLTNYFMKELNNDIGEAQEKANLIVSRSSGMIYAKGGNVTVNDVNDNGRAITIPISSYDADGVRYHNDGNGRATAVKGFTPYALDAAMGKTIVENGQARIPSSAEVIKGMAPEMMLKYTDDTTPLKQTIDNISSHFSYDSNTQGSSEPLTNNFKLKSENLKAVSNQVSYGLIRNTRYDGSIDPQKPFRKISQIATKTNQVSEEAFVRANLMPYTETAGSNFLGVSNNDTLAIQNGKYSTLSMFPPMERNVSGSVLRETRAKTKTYGAQIVDDFMGVRGGDNLYASPQVIRKLDIKDTTMFNKFTTAFLEQNDAVLDDGFGLYNKDSNRIFTSTQETNIKVPLTKDLVVHHPQLKAAIDSGNVANYLETHGAIRIDNKDPLFTILGGKQVGIGDQFTSATINSAMISNDNLILNTLSEFNPSSENHVKVFSVGSKSLVKGVVNNDFNVISTFGALMNEGKVRYDDEGMHILDTDLRKSLGNKAVLSLEDMDDLRFDTKFLEQYASPIDMITDADNTGYKDFLKLHKDDQITKDFLKTAGIEELEKLPNYNPTTGKIATLLTTEHKGSEDLLAHTLTRLMTPLKKMELGQTLTKSDIIQLQNMQSSGLLTEGFDVQQSNANKEIHNQMIKDSQRRVMTAFNSSLDHKRHLDPKHREAALRNVYKFVEVAGVSDDFQRGISGAIGSSNVGSSIVGAGNNARMSWTAYQQLRLSGYSKEQLELFGKTDKGLVYEMEGILSEDRVRGNQSVNNAVGGTKGFSTLEQVLANSIPEERIGKLSEMIPGFTMGTNPYLTYDLAYTGHETKSLNFSTITGNRSGKFEYKDKETLKALEKKRLDILSLDISYSQAKASERKAIQDELVKKLTEYQTFKNSAFSGDNNLLKNSASLYSKSSSILEAAPVGGSAQDFINSIERDASGKYNNKQIARTAFASKEGIENIASKLGIAYKDLEFRHTEFDGLQTVAYRDTKGNLVPLSALVTREPAQGQLSTQFMDIMFDSTLKGGGNNIFFTKEQFGYTVGMTGDFDQDTLQTMFSKMSREEYQSMSRVSQSILERNTSTMEVQSSMSVKSGDRALKTIRDFNSEEEFFAYKQTADYKGKVRKIFSPLSTITALNYTKALDLEYGDDMDKKSLGRVAAYKSVENLIKSSHIETEKFSNRTQIIEELNIAREKYLKGGSADSYRKVLNTHLPDMLGYTGTTDSRDTTIKASADLIIDAEINQARRVSQMVKDPVDVNVNRGSKSVNNAVREAMDNLGMFDMQRGISASESPRQLYHSINNAIVDTARKNKGLLAGGLAGLVGVNLLGRSSPNFEESRAQANSRPHGKLMRAPNDIDDAIQSIPTQTKTTGYIAPQNYNTSNLANVSGDIVDDYIAYNELDSTVYDRGADFASSLSDQVFGGGLRNTRITLTDL